MHPILLLAVIACLLSSGTQAAELVLSERTAKLVSVIDAGERVYSMALSPTGKHVAIFSRGTRIWDVATGKLLATLPDVGAGHPPRSLALLDDPCVGVASEYRTDPSDDSGPLNISVFTCDGKVLASLSVEHLVHAGPMEFTVVPQCRLVVIQFSIGVAVIDTRTLSVRDDLSRLFPNPTDAVGVSPESCVVFAGSSPAGAETKVSRIVRIDLKAGKASDVLALPGDKDLHPPLFEGEQIAVSPDGGLLAFVVWQIARDSQSPLGNRRIEIVGQGGKQPAQFRFGRLEAQAVEALAFVSRDELLAIGSGWGNALHLIDYTKNKVDKVDLGQATQSKEFGYPLALNYSPTARRLAIAGTSEVRVYDLDE